MSLFIVKTPHGAVTSYRKVWETEMGRAVYAWRTDGGQPVHWPTRDEAWAWVASVWADDPKELPKAGWEVTEG